MKTKINRILLQGDVIKKLAEIESVNIQCVVTNPYYYIYNNNTNCCILIKRNAKGQFLKGHRSHPETEFKKGEHWRPRQPFYNKEWLEKEYETKSMQMIADEFGVTEAAIAHWMRKHKIPRRSTSEARRLNPLPESYSGSNNGMWGRYGELSGNWRGGSSPQRQLWYTRKNFKKIRTMILHRDNHQCQICFSKNELHIHHIFPFAEYKAFRFLIDNLTTICRDCHIKLHTKGVRR